MTTCWIHLYKTKYRVFFGKAIFSKNGKFYTFKVWSLETGDLVHNLLGHEDSITSVSISSDNRFVVTGSWYNTSVWSLETGKEVLNPPKDLAKNTPNFYRSIGQRIYNPLKSLDDIFLELGKIYSLRPCPEPPYKMVSVHPHPAPTTSFVPNELVQTYCGDSKP